MKTISARLQPVKTQHLADLFFFAYMCIPLLELVFSKILSYAGLMEYGPMIALPVAYIPLVLLFAGFMITGKPIRDFIPEFWLLLIAIILWFAVTYLLHPEYEYWYFRETYGIWDYVLRPSNGLFIYLAIRLINDPDRILNVLRYSGFFMYLYYGRILLQSLAQGYWTDSSNKGFDIRMSYSLSFGYNVLIFALAFLYAGLERRSLIDLGFGGIGVVMILLGGSRGPILDIAIFVLLYMFIKINDRKRKALLMTAVAVFGILFLLTYKYLLMAAAAVIGKFGLSSRFIDMMIEGSVSNDNGRELIWKTAIGMIKEHPLGYGAMGTRHVIGDIIFVGHPHQIFLEILVDFGVIFGTLLILWLLLSSARIILSKQTGAWKGIFVVFFARACQLLVSLTYWHSIGLWAAIAVGVCAYSNRKKGSKISWGKIGLRM